MKKVLLVGLVGLLMLCVAGLAVAEEPVWEAYTLEELSLTLKLPSSWAAGIGGEAENLLESDDTLNTSAFEDITCHLWATYPYDGANAGWLYLFSAKNPFAGISSYRDYSIEEMLTMDLPTLTTEQTVVIAPYPPLEERSDLVGTLDGRFVLTGYLTEDSASAVLSTIEHDRFIWFEYLYASEGTTMQETFGQILTTLQFLDTPPVTTRETVVTDADAWREGFIDIMMSGSPGETWPYGLAEPITNEENGLWLIDQYDTGDTRVDLQGTSRDNIQLASVATVWDGQENLTDIENEFYVFAAVSMLATLGETDSSRLMECIEFLRTSIQTGKDAEPKEAFFQYYSWNGCLLMVGYGPYENYMTYYLAIHTLS
ncbi:MAG: hypothetical protein LBN04_05795 [Oscillospiraceae bacterium]|nr:hypothetical protein [Oscillospiraceae bacterium]